MAEAFLREEMNGHYNLFCKGQKKYEGIHPAYALAKLYSSIHPSDMSKGIDPKRAHETAKSIYFTGHIWGFDTNKPANAKEFDSAFTAIGQLLALGEGLAFQAEVNQKFASTPVNNPLCGHMEVLNNMVNGIVTLAHENISAYAAELHGCILKILQARPKGGKGPLAELKNKISSGETILDFSSVYEYRSNFLKLVGKQTEYLAQNISSLAKVMEKARKYGLGSVKFDHFLQGAVEQENEELLSQVLEGADSTKFTDEGLRQALERAFDNVYTYRNESESNNDKAKRKRVFARLIKYHHSLEKKMQEIVERMALEYLQAAPGEFTTSEGSFLYNTKLPWFLGELVHKDYHTKLLTVIYSQIVNSINFGEPESFNYRLENYLRRLLNDAREFGWTGIVDENRRAYDARRQLDERHAGEDAAAEEAAAAAEVEDPVGSADQAGDPTA